MKKPSILVKGYTVNNQHVLIAEPAIENCTDFLIKILDLINQPKIVFKDEVKVRNANTGQIAYISEIKQVRSIYMVKIEIGDDHAFRQAKDLDEATTLALIRSLKFLFQKSFK